METARTELTAEDIGVRLRAVRELTGLSVGELAKASGVPRRDINAAEHGRRVLDAAGMRSVAGALGVAPGVLVSSLPPSDTDEPGGGTARAATRRPTERPAPIPFDLPAAERRIDDDSRADLEKSWVAVRGDMQDVIEAATRLAMCASTDDPTALMRKVAFEIDKLDRKRSFQQNVARHQAELLEARAAGPGNGTAP